MKMDSELQPHSLLKDELIYEVSIRSETPSSTIVSLQRQLRSLLEEYPSEAIFTTDLKAESEIKTVGIKLVNFEQTVKKYLSSKDLVYRKFLFHRLRSLGIHLKFRLFRVQCEDDPALLDQKLELTSTIENLYSLLESEVGAQPNTSCSNLAECCSGDNSVSKWNINFNGFGDPKSFIERVDEFQLSYGVSDKILFNSASFLFTGQANIWYNGNKSQVSSWPELKDLFLEDFLPVDYDYRLMSEIRSRTQGVDEPIHIYFSVMSILFSRLKKSILESEQLDILLHNIRPHFSQQLALIQVSSVLDLKKYCRQLEAAQKLSETFFEPPKASVLNSELIYKGKSKSVAAVTNNYRQKHTNNDFTNSANPNRIGNKGKLLCFKCGKPDHSFRLCKVSFTGPIKCFDCGELGYTAQTCPKCNKLKFKFKN